MPGTDQPASDERGEEHWMEVALRLAATADHATSPNPMVGAVVVADGRIVGQGVHRRAGAPHAEVHALAAASAASRGADLYVTLEPCNHQGRTPACTAAIIDAGIRRVVVAMLDPNPRVDGAGVAALRAAGLAVEVGVGAVQAAQLVEFYAHHARTGRPFVTAKFAASLDGRVTTAGGDSQWITGDSARAHGHRLRHQHDVVLVGAGTAGADDPRLSTRLEGRPDARQPLRVVVDSRLRLPARLRMHDRPGQSLVATRDDAPFAARRLLEAAGVEVLSLPGGADGRVDLGALLTDLGGRGHLALLAEGGPTLLGALFDGQLVQRVVAMLAPRIIGGPAPAAVAGTGVARLADAALLGRVTVERSGPDLIVTGYCVS
ncbi:MAG: bifunctional diaminohydroxyphosphoribosylaminopyrimidine deaminase/5-amino-6-(5-phosphoribosylamino)uracil reductase RibD [Candidatus Dormibacteria bacterium]